MFHFRLERVRTYRKHLEDQAMQALAQALAEQTRLEARMEYLHEERTATRQKLLQIASLDAGQRWVLATYETALAADMHTTQEYLEQQKIAVTQQRQELVIKARQRQLLDKLKEKQAERYAQNELQKELHTNDETAIIRFRPAVR